MNPLMTGIITGILASFMLTPIGGVVIGILAYKMARDEKEKNNG